MEQTLAGITDIKSKLSKVQDFVKCRMKVVVDPSIEQPVAVFETRPQIRNIIFFQAVRVCSKYSKKATLAVTTESIRMKVIATARESFSDLESKEAVCEVAAQHVLYSNICLKKSLSAKQSERTEIWRSAAAKTMESLPLIKGIEIVQNVEPLIKREAMEKLLATPQLLNMSNTTSKHLKSRSETNRHLAWGRTMTFRRRFRYPVHGVEFGRPIEDERPLGISAKPKTHRSNKQYIVKRMLFKDMINQRDDEEFPATGQGFKNEDFSDDKDSIKAKIENVENKKDPSSCHSSTSFEPGWSSKRPRKTPNLRPKSCKKPEDTEPCSRGPPLKKLKFKDEPSNDLE